MFKEKKISGFEKKHVFSYTSMDEQTKVILGIKKSGASRLLMAKYGIMTNNREYELKDKLGIHFSVVLIGKMDIVFSQDPINIF